MNPRRWSGRVVIVPGRLVFLGPGARADRHAHHAVQIALSFAAPIRVTIGAEPIEREALVIPADVEHELEVVDQTPVALIFVDPEGARGRALQAEAFRDPELGDRLAGIEPPREHATLDELRAWIERALDRLIPAAPRREPMHAAVQAVLELLREPGERPRVPELAASVGISASRLTHLFGEQVGIPLRGYLLWRRLQRAAAIVRTGASLTEAAHAAGFADSAHLSRTFKAHYGIPPSQVLPLLSYAELVDA
ncbi:helix-turn-helix domain-containing protein [Nannocystaceae bacterium ST9]